MKNYLLTIESRSIPTSFVDFLVFEKPWVSSPAPEQGFFADWSIQFPSVTSLLLSLVSQPPLSVWLQFLHSFPHMAEGSDKASEPPRCLALCDMLNTITSVDPENLLLQPRATTNDRPDVIVRFIELLPHIIHGHGPHVNGSNRIQDLDHERTD